MEDSLSQFSGELPMEDFQTFVKEVYRHFGLDLSGYKAHRVKRRTEILVKKYGLQSFRDYMNLLLKDQNLLETSKPGARGALPEKNRIRWLFF